jgi:hypothetical protein
MHVLHWLLNISCFTLALVPGRVEALGIAHVDKLSPLLTGPIAAIYFYLVASRTMKVGKHCQARLQNSRFRPVRRVAGDAADENLKLPGWVRALLVTAATLIPMVGLWVAIGLAMAYRGQALARVAWLIGVSSAASLVIPQLFLKKALPSASGLQPTLEILSYVAVGGFVIFQMYRHRTRLRLLLSGKTTPVASPTSPA